MANPPTFSNVQLLLNFDGNTTDLSSNARTPDSAAGSVGLVGFAADIASTSAMATAVAKFGQALVRSGDSETMGVGYGYDYTSGDLVPSEGEDFTCEFWLSSLEAFSGVQGIVIDGGGLRIRITHFATKSFEARVAGASATVDLVYNFGSDDPFDDGASHFYVFQKEGSTYSIWFDGTRVAQDTQPSQLDLGETGTIYIGGDSSASNNSYAGAFDSLRITKEAVYEGSPASIPVPTSPFPSGIPESDDLRQRAWQFTFDGHPFYVLRLGNTSTLVYDLLTGQWAEWETDGYDTWNANNGLDDWEGYPVAGDGDDGNIYRVSADADVTNDQGSLDIQRRISAIIPHTGTNWASQGDLRVSASVGDPVDTDIDLELSWSDDQGQTYTTQTILLEQSAFRQMLWFQSLGSFQSPGRVVRISDKGGLVRIDGIDADLRGIDVGSN